MRMMILMLLTLKNGANNMQVTNSNIEKIASNRTRSRLAFGEVNERRQRNDKRHKPDRLPDVTKGTYDPSTHKRVAEHKRLLKFQTRYLPGFDE